MDFVTSHFGKMNLWPIEHFYNFWAWLLLYSAITPKSEDKYVVKVFNWSEVHLSEMTCYKIHTLKEKCFKPWMMKKLRTMHLFSPGLLHILLANKSNDIFLLLNLKSFTIRIRMSRDNHLHETLLEIWL